MPKTHFSEETLHFYRELRNNNNRPWFQEQKERYDLVKEESHEFLAIIEDAMNQHDDIERAKVLRIYRDVRFSKDKTPYKTSLSISFTRRKPGLRGGYFLQVTPGDQSFIAAGFWNPESSDLKLIRQNIDFDHQNFRKAINSPPLKKVWGDMQGVQVKTSPKGYDKNHPAIDLLRHKQFIFTRSYSDTDVTTPEFVGNISKSFQAIRPFFDYMSMILTHDLNGEPLY